jgi:hypothetical protein
VDLSCWPKRLASPIGCRQTERSATFFRPCWGTGGVFEGADEEAFVLAVSENISHGLVLTLPNRRAAAARILESHPVGCLLESVNRGRASTMPRWRMCCCAGHSAPIRPIQPCGRCPWTTPTLAATPCCWSHRCVPTTWWRSSGTDADCRGSPAVSSRNGSRAGAGSLRSALTHTSLMVNPACRLPSRPGRCGSSSTG